MDTAPQGQSHSLSVVLSGGISLGAYFAGAVAQIGYFVAKWNATAEQRGAPKIFVDVVSGASAGAMTGAMLFRFVGTGCQDAEGFVRANFDAWCSDDLSFGHLLDPKNTGEPSFLSNVVVEKAGERFLPPHGEIDLAFGQQRLIYTCTLTSLQPIPFGINLKEPRLAGAPTEQPKKLLGQTRRDFITFRITPEGHVDARYRGAQGFTNQVQASSGLALMELASDPAASAQSLWERLRWAALASGAFPVAWMPVRIPRKLDLYPPAMPRTQEGLGWFTYSDGGIIDNVPLGRAAKVLQDYAKFSSAGSEDVFGARSYVLIEQSEIDAGAGPPPATASDRSHRLRDGSVGEQLGTVLEAMREQSLYMDLRTASHINKRLDLRTHTIWPTLAELVRSIPVGQVEAYEGRVIASLKELLKSSDDARTPADIVERYRSRTDVQDALASDAFPSVTPDRIALFAGMAAVLDLIADLGDKHQLNLLRITPGRQLYSAFLGNFGGFVKRTYMVRDFQQGLADAQLSLTRLLGPGTAATSLEGVFFDPARLDGEVPLEERHLQPPSGMDDVYPTERKAFMGLVQARMWPFVALLLADPPTRRRYLRGDLRPPDSLLEAVSLSAKALLVTRLVIGLAGLVFGACAVGFWSWLSSAGMADVPALFVSLGLVLVLGFLLVEIGLYFAGEKLGLRPPARPD